MNPSNINVFRFGALLAAVLVVLLFGGQAIGEEDYPDTIIFVKPVKAVAFEHKTHVDQGLECDSCHDDLFEMEAGTAEANDDFTMESLYQGKYCGACHDGDMAFASNTRCTVCHIGVKGYNRTMGGGKAESGGH